MSIRKFGTYATREEFLDNEIRALNHHILSMIDTMKVMSMNKQDMSDEIERLKLEVKTEVLAEREACAKVCEEYADDSRTGATCAKVIRARGEA
jgi:hypothetical protein